jgi:hypothetical protein
VPNGRHPLVSGIFSDDFVFQIRNLVRSHHLIYPQVPPQGIYFEALVEHAFRLTRTPFTPVKPTARNQPTHDLVVANARISLKTETGTSTDPDDIHITKLCTTEREPWTARVLIGRVVEHLSRYDIILMLRAIWELPVIHYQLLEIPVDTLRLIETANPQPTGRRAGRKSLGADVFQDGEVLFHVHFDGSDGKCSLRGLHVRDCVTLATWDLQIED